MDTFMIDFVNCSLDAEVACGMGFLYNLVSQLQSWNLAAFDFFEDHLFGCHLLQKNGWRAIVSRTAECIGDDV
jgi:hypothetical protein